jgi:hypothetical protein
VGLPFSFPAPVKQMINGQRYPEKEEDELENL